MPETDAKDTAPIDVPRLVAQVLESDETLRAEATDSNLTEEDLSELLSGRLDEPDAQGRLESRTKRDAAERELAVAEKVFGEHPPRPRWLRRTKVVWTVLTLGTIAAFAMPDGIFEVTVGVVWFVAWVVLLAAVYVFQRIVGRRYDAAGRDAAAEIADKRAALISMSEEFERDLVDAWVKPAIRDEVNSRAGSRFQTVMEPVEYQGLAGDDPRHTISTVARDRLEQFLSHKRYGSIGLSGPRGAGKTSLIRASCPDGDVSAENLCGVIVTAPVEFEAREFVLHLFGRLCATVLGREGLERVRRPPSPIDRELRLPQALLVAAVLALLAAAAIVLVAEEVVREEMAWAAVIAAAGILALGLIGVAAWARRRAALRSPPSPSAFSPELEDYAASRLRDIWFQQSFTTGWSGAVKLPVGVEGGLEGTHELSRLQMSLPDVVGEIEQLVAAIVSEDRNVRIGIDELDKLSDTDKARQFLNEMKVLFGIPNCFWLVSISEDAMSSFERRGLPLRDEFDSSFTNVIRVSPQTAEGTIQLLRRRLVGVPQPFMLLCHCLAGGLPRDVLRVAWDVVAYTGTHGTSHLNEMCAELVGDHVVKKVDAMLVATHRLPQTPPVHELQAWLLEVRGQGTGPETLLPLCRNAHARLAPVLRAPEGVDEALELVSYALFAATCQEFFRGLPIDEVDTARWNDVMADANRLGAAQQAFSVHPHAAWIATNAVRVALALDELPYPAPAPDGRPPKPAPVPA